MKPDLHLRKVVERLALSTLALFFCAIPAAATTYTVTNTASSGPGSLKQAILDANANPGADVINFNIPGSGPFVISPTTANPLNYITDPVTIDGYSQPGAAVATSTTAATLKIEIDGSSTSTADGLMLEIGSDGSTIKGLAIRNFSGGSGILVLSGSNTIQGCYLGTDVGGSSAQGNIRGIAVGGRAGNIIGGTTAAARNLISGNSAAGVHVVSAPDSVISILGNYIGTDVTGNAALGNNVGIYYRGGLPYIGSSAAGSGNVISGNTTYGIDLDGSDVQSGFVMKNMIGIGADGSTAVQNQDGIHISGARMMTIGGMTAGDGNVVSGNDRYGIDVDNGYSIGIIRNMIGTNAAGTAGMGNQEEGVRIEGGTNIYVGGSIGAYGNNVISGNSGAGIHLLGGTTLARIQGNRIGTNAAGTTAIANGYGVLVDDVAGNTIGGENGVGGNQISGNTYGIYLTGSSTSNNAIIGNRIGTDATGMAAIPNAHGIYVAGSASTTIGGTGLGHFNVISGNSTAGITIDGAAATTVISNIIGANVIGTAAVGNLHGVHIIGSHGHRIGGSTLGWRNIIAGNTEGGIWIQGSPASPLPGGNRIEGNLIGRLVTLGGSVIANRYGIILDGATYTTIGGTGANEGNSISGNTEHGIDIRGTSAQQNTIRGNRIGLTPGGFDPVPNGGDGIHIESGSENIIGGSAPGAENIIAWSTGNGIHVGGSSALSNSISRNSTYANGGLGIDLDLGNNAQSAPAISSASAPVGGDLTVSYEVPATAGATYPLTVEFFISDLSGEGSRYIGTDSYAAAGVPETATMTPPSTIYLMPGSHRIVASATDANGNTSEFSNEVVLREPITVVAPNGGETLCAGATTTITWTSSGFANARIDLSGDGGATWTNIVASTPAAAGSYSWTIPTALSAGTDYRVRISNAAASASADESDASFTINTPPVATITSNPFPIADAFTDVTFVSTATGTPAPTVQWEVRPPGIGNDFTPIQGATSPTLLLSSVTAADHLNAYRAVYSNSCGTGTSMIVILQVAKVPASVTLLNLNHLYDGTAQAATATTTPAGLDVDITYSQNGSPVAAPTDAGSYDVTAAIDDPNYSGSTTGTLVIDKATLQVTAQNRTRVYGAANPPLSYQISGFVNGEGSSVVLGGAAISTAATPTSPVGTYPITVSQGTLSAANYQFAFNDAILTVDPAPLAVVAGNASMECGGAMPTLTGTVTGAQNGETFVVAYATAPVTSGPGTYAIVPSITGGADLSNYDVTYTNGTLTIADGLAPVPTVASLPTLTGQCGVSGITAPTAVDQCTGMITATTDDPLSYAAQGTYTIDWVYTDASGNSATQQQTVVVLDNSAPTLSVSLSPTTLWSPNNQMRTIDVTASVGDNCGNGGATWVLTSVTGNDGTVAADISAATGSAATSFQVRAKRSGGGSGRTYTALFTATDAAGNTATQTVTIFVPHDQAKPALGEASTGKRSFASVTVPNPFTTATEIRYTLPTAGVVKVRVIDMLGREVATLVDAEAAAGEQVARWTGTDAQGTKVAAGTYLYVIEAGGRTESGRIVLTR